MSNDFHWEVNKYSWQGTVTEISPKLHSGKVSTLDKSLGEAVGPRVGGGLGV